MCRGIRRRRSEARNSLLRPDTYGKVQHGDLPAQQITGETAVRGSLKLLSKLKRLWLSKFLGSLNVILIKRSTRSAEFQRRAERQ